MTIDFFIWRLKQNAEEIERLSKEIGIELTPAISLKDANKILSQQQSLINWLKEKEKQKHVLQ